MILLRPCTSFSVVVANSLAVSIQHVNSTFARALTSCVVGFSPDICNPSIIILALHTHVHFLPLLPPPPAASLIFLETETEKEERNTKQTPARKSFLPLPNLFSNRNKRAKLEEEEKNNNNRIAAVSFLSFLSDDFISSLPSSSSSSSSSFLTK